MLTIKLDSRLTLRLFIDILALNRDGEHPILWITLLYPTGCLYGIWVVRYSDIQFFLLMLTPMSLRHDVSESFLIAHPAARIILVIESTSQSSLMIKIVGSFQISYRDLSHCLPSLWPCLFACISCEHLLKFQGVILGHLIIVEAILIVIVHCEPIESKDRTIIPCEASLEAWISVGWGQS